MTPEERQEKGPAIHDLRESVTAAIAGRKAALDGAALEARLAAERIDMTLPAEPVPMGSIHPVSQVMDELAEIFADLGFAVATGPIEDDWHNSRRSTFPRRTRRARCTTPSISPTRTGTAATCCCARTSPVQIRTMTATPAPIRIIAPGRVYRSDSDATHTPMFHQIEGLVIDKAIHMGHLKWTLETFLKAFFERDDIVLRLRPSYFPFTEPSAEVDVGFSWEKGKRVIGGSDGWMEVLGSGMVHPKVIEACGLDPNEWQGFAFGCGIDRLAMLKYGMEDLRAFFDGDLRWLRHYGFSALDVPTLSGGVGRMKFTLSWLEEHLETSATLDAILIALTDIGLEVEGVENPAEKLKGFKIARVLTAKPHPQADKLQVLTVDAGTAIRCRSSAAPPMRARGWSACSASRARRCRPTHGAAQGGDPRRRLQRHDVLLARAGAGRRSRRHHRAAGRCAGGRGLCRLCPSRRSGHRRLGHAQPAGTAWACAALPATWPPRGSAH